MTIGEKIAHLRTHARMTQEQLADHLGISRQSVSKWEVDQAEPRMEKILQMCTLFQISADDMIREDVVLHRSHTLPDPEFRGNYFGTDGFRGEAGTELTAEHAFKVGRFLGWYYANPISGCREHGYRPRVVIGKDTRRSSYALEYALAAGLTASGADASILHVTTTPGVSYVTRNDNFDCGVMISASHNPFYDNGIKLVNRHGEKMDDRTLALIEAYLDGRLQELGLKTDDLPLATHERMGTIVDHVAGRNRYMGYLISLAAHSYRELRIGLDCANGAAWMIAPAVFEALGARTFVINASPDGLNINREAGATHTGTLQAFVRDNGLDVGFAFDGDGDRCIAVDERGNVLTGDHILYILANRLRSRGGLDRNTVVTTVMSNAGLLQALDRTGITAVQTRVGDRYVYENMMENGYALGGEQSGHIIMRKYATTGDGILTALMLIEEMLDRKQTLGALAAQVKILPQVLKNIRVCNKAEVIADADICRRTEELERSLENCGRVLVRESGTEPVIRIMVEAAEETLCENCAESIAELIRQKGYAQP
ncbi:MAG: phosphoglucosamine mutase [Clostridia bacterium]|nr:phosphoglucosamine mutase [Clostridia bacterium]